jgi:hypothetical protein
MTSRVLLLPNYTSGAIAPIFPHWLLGHLAAELSGKSYDTEEREFLTDCFFQIAASLELSDFVARYGEWETSGKFKRRFT